MTKGLDQVDLFAPREEEHSTVEMSGFFEPVDEGDIAEPVDAAQRVERLEDPELGRSDEPLEEIHLDFLLVEDGNDVDPRVARGVTASAAMVGLQQQLIQGLVVPKNPIGRSLLVATVEQDPVFALRVRCFRRHDETEIKAVDLTIGQDSGEVILHRPLPADIDQMERAIGGSGHLLDMSSQKPTLFPASFLVALAEAGMSPEGLDVDRSGGALDRGTQIGRQLIGEVGREAEAGNEVVHAEVGIMGQDRFEPLILDRFEAG